LKGRGLFAGLFFVALGWAAPARAAVTIDFYTHELALVASGLNTYFPHGFVLLSGTTEDGTAVRTNLGFTAKNVFFNILWEKVTGEMDPVPLPAGYVEGAIRHFSFPLTEAQYRAVMATADRWRNAPQPSYDLDSTNCVTFVKEIAIAAGLSVSEDRKFIHAPGDFVPDIARRNAAFLGTFGPQPALSMPVGDPAALERRVQQLERNAREKMGAD
jgi:hypothetical protein